MYQAILLDMIRYFGNDARRINHALKVYGFARTILSFEQISGTQKDIIELAAILHDIGIHEAERKHQSTSGKYQEIEGPPIARRILKTREVPPAIIDRVCYLVGNHHSYTKIDSRDFQILVEADFLVNIFEDDLSTDAIGSIGSKYFKTESGKEILNAMYLRR